MDTSKRSIRDLLQLSGTDSILFEILLNKNPIHIFYYFILYFIIFYIFYWSNLKFINTGAPKQNFFTVKYEKIEYLNYYWHYIEKVLFSCKS